jgi:predicted O-methyltransferase YrrM
MNPNHILHYFNLHVTRINPRPFIRMLKTEGMKNILGIEVGVAQGENAAQMLKHLDIETLFLIDNYQPPFNTMKDKAIRLLDGKPITWMMMHSQHAASILEENQMDFVYIDADHSYKSTLNDLEAYYPLLKSGGFMGGDDITIGSVMAALLDFAHTHSIKIITVNQREWWFQKEG